MITSNVNRVIYKGNGVATEFAYPFKIFDRTDIKVLLVDKDGERSILTSDYYVDMESMKVFYPGYAPGAEEPETDRPDILQEGETLVIYREVPITQMDRLPDNYPFNVIEKMDDKSCVIDQQLADKLTRAITMGEETALTFDGTMPPIQPGKTLRVKEDGSGWEFTEDPGAVYEKTVAEKEQAAAEARAAALSADSANRAAQKAYDDHKAIIEKDVTDAQNAANRAEETVNKAVEEAYDDVKDLVEQRVQDAKGYAEEAETQAGGARGYADNAKASANEAEQYAEELSDTIDKVDNVRSYTDYMGWTVFKVDDTNYIAGRTFQTKNITLSKYADYTWMSPTLEVPLPFPSSIIDVSGTCDSNGVYIANVNGNSINNGTGVVTFRLGRGGNPGQAINAYTRMTVLGKIATAPTSPTIAHNAEGAAQVISIAQSYINARVNGRKFTYGKNFFYADYDYINDSRGYAKMECDTFVGMCIRGIPYEQSPFANTTPYYQYSYADMMSNMANPNNWVWCNRLITQLQSTNTLLGRDARYVNDMSFLSWRTAGCIFTNESEARTGDLVFFRNPKTATAFDHVSHIALLSIENGVKYIYHVSSEGLTEGRVVEKMRLADRPNPPCYFARIDYSNI